MRSPGGASKNAVLQMRTYEPDVINAIFTRLDVSCPKEINVRFVTSRLGELSLIRSIHDSGKCVSKRLQRHMGKADCNNYFVCVPLEGGLRIRHLGRLSDLRSGELGIVATNEEYEVEMSDYLDALWLRVPAPLLREQVYSVDQLLGSKIDISGGVGAAAMELMRVSIKEENELSLRGENLVARALIGFIGEMLNSRRQNELGRTSCHKLKILERAREYIEEHISDEDLSPLQVARGIGISARYLSEIFAAEGISVMRWVQRRRLERCRMEFELRAGGQQLIREIAYSTGFVNISSFNRAFKAQFGESPRSLIHKQRRGYLND